MEKTPGKLMKEARLRPDRKWTLRQVALRLPMNPVSGKPYAISSLSAWEHDERPVPHELIDDVCAALTIQREDFVRAMGIRVAPATPEARISDRLMEGILRLNEVQRRNLEEFLNP